MRSRCRPPVRRSKADQQDDRGVAESAQNTDNPEQYRAPTIWLDRATHNTNHPERYRTPMSALDPADRCTPQDWRSSRCVFEPPPASVPISDTEWDVRFCDIFGDRGGFRCRLSGWAHFPTPTISDPAGGCRVSFGADRCRQSVWTTRVTAHSSREVRRRIGERQVLGCTILGSQGRHDHADGI